MQSQTLITFIYILENRELLCKNGLSLNLSSLSLHTFCQLVSLSECASWCVISQESIVTRNRREFQWRELRTAENCKLGRSRKIHLNLRSATSAAHSAAFFGRSVNSLFYSNGSITGCPVCIQYFIGQKSILFLQGWDRKKSVYKIKLTQVWHQQKRIKWSEEVVSLNSQFQYMPLQQAVCIRNVLQLMCFRSSVCKYTHMQR